MFLRGLSRAHARRGASEVFSHATATSKFSTIPVSFITAEGENVEVNAEIGDNMLDVAHDNDIELEGIVGTLFKYNPRCWERPPSLVYHSCTRADFVIDGAWHVIWFGRIRFILLAIFLVLVAFQVPPFYVPTIAGNVWFDTLHFVWCLDFLQFPSSWPTIPACGPLALWFFPSPASDW